MFSECPKNDSALVCFSIVANRLDRAKGKEDLKILTEAYIGLWTCYFFSYFDYKQAFEYLAKAKSVAEKTDEVMKARVYFCYGNIYQTLAKQWRDKAFAQRAIDSYRQAFEEGCAINNREIVNLAFANLIPLMFESGSFDNIKNLWVRHEGCMATGESNQQIEAVALMYNGFMAMHEQRYKEAVESFKRQIDILGNNTKVFRNKFNAYENLGMALALDGRYAEAIDSIKIIERWARENDMKDGKLEVYELLNQFYSQSGEQEPADAYQRDYFALKDSMQNFQRVMSVGELEFLDKIDAANREVNSMRERQRRSQLIIGTILCFLFVVIISFVIVYRKNRALHDANRTLYKKHADILAVEDEIRRLHNKKAIECDGDEEQPSGTKTKYRNSVLTDDDKASLMCTIREAMESSDMIYNSDFTVTRLAEVVNSNYRYVSQVINECTGANFNSFINEYRIKEACRRIDSAEFGNLTLEALANSVGFKSRTSFVTLFKSFTGLTPSEYVKIAKERAKCSKS